MVPRGIKADEKDGAEAGIREEQDVYLGLRNAVPLFHRTTFKARHTPQYHGGKLDAARDYRANLPVQEGRVARSGTRIRLQYENLVWSRFETKETS